jgi:hypothetical protein
MVSGWRRTGPWIFLCSRWSAAGEGSGPGFFSVLDGQLLERDRALDFFLCSDGQRLEGDRALDFSLF